MADALLYSPETITVLLIGYPPVQNKRLCLKKKMWYIHTVGYYAAIKNNELMPFIATWQWHPTPVLLPGKSPGRRSLVGCSPWGRWQLDTTQWLHFLFSLSCIGEGNGNPLQCSCLENPRDGGAWWAAIYGVAQSRTRLKRLSSSSTATWIDLEMIILTEVSRRQIYDITYLWNLKKYSTNELIYKMEIESQMWKNKHSCQGERGGINGETGTAVSTLYIK